MQPSIVNRVHRLAVNNQIKEDSEVFVITDNVVTESIFYKGSSKSSLLHDLIVRLQKMELEKQLRVHVVWCSGERMIEIGVDGLSRADFSSGVMKGDDLLKFLPFSKLALERFPPLQSVIKSWTEKFGDFEFTTPADWFDSVFNHKGLDGTLDADSKCWVWTPSPCSAQVAIEQMCKMKHIFPYSSHVFVCPAVMTAYWRKILGKISDTMFTIKAGSFIWPSDMYEPLTIAFVKPFLSKSLWKVGQLQSVVEWERDVREVQFKDKTLVRNHMRKFWKKVGR